MTVFDQPGSFHVADAVLARWHHDPHALVQVLRETQSQTHWLPCDLLAYIGRVLGLTLAHVEGVASFYRFFHLRPVGRVRVLFSDNITDRMAGSDALMARLCERLGVAPGEVDAQGRFSVDRCSCTGLCEQGPTLLVNHHQVVTRLDAARIDQLAERLLAGEPPEDWPADWFAVQDHIRRADVLLQGLPAGAPDLPVVLACEPAELLAEVERSGLRGRGGAGFPTARKWRACAEADAADGQRCVVCNADEGEPGTFKDRHYLERDPHRFLEGMLIAAWAVGIARIYIYLRDEYHGCRALLEAELARLRAKAPWPGMPPIELRRGAGAYICGEESAMIESIEGKRGMPRLRPPYVAQVGLFGRPTLEHNFETLYWVRDILEKGGAWFAGHGRNGRKGLRSFSVSGRVRNPGVKLAPAGITIRELIDEHCGGMADGHAFYAYLPGGASGGILPATMGDIPLDFDTLQPHGCFIGSAAVVVLSRHDSAVGAARNLMRFFRHESCGQCTPCRNGTAKASELIEQPRWNLELLADLSQVMRDASICGLGQAAPNPVDCVVKYFPEELT